MTTIHGAATSRDDGQHVHTPSEVPCVDAHDVFTTETAGLPEVSRPSVLRLHVMYNVEELYEDKGSGQVASR